MRRSNIMILLIMAVIIGLVGIAYVTGTLHFGNGPVDVQTETNTDGGLQLAVNTPDTSQSSLTTLGEALDQLQQHLKGTPSSSNFTLYYIRGRDLDIQGRAEQWVFGVRYANQSVLMYFDAPGWRSVSWEGALPEREIIPGSYTPPAGIIRYTMNYLSPSEQTPEILIKRLELMNGKYTITIERQGMQQTFVFDSVELIP